MPGNLPLNQLSHKHRSNSPANSVFLKWRMQLHLFSEKEKKTKMKGAQHLRPLRGKGGSWKGPHIFSSHRLPRGSHPRPIYGENLQGYKDTEIINKERTLEGPEHELRTQIQV